MSTEIATLSTLFNAAWTQYKKRALPLLAVMLISAVVIGGLIMALVLCATVGGAMLIHVTDQQTAALLVVIVVSVLLLVVTLLVFWSQTTLLALVVNEALGIVEAFQAGWNYLWPMTWVLTLLSGILITGFLLGVLPGILFAVWFVFCMFVLLEEDRRGMDALLASKAYVRGHWWNTCGKLLLLWLISAAGGLVPFVGQIFSLLFTPFMMLFLLAMYRDLKAVNGVAEVDAGAGARIFWWALALIGLALPLVGLAAGLFSLLSGEQGWGQLQEALRSHWLQSI